MARITAVDVQHKSFKKSLQGYDRAEVDQFLDELIESMEDEAQGRAALEAEMSDLRERIGHFKAMEESLQNTLLLAQRTADEVKAAAQQRAHLMLEEARVAAERETGAIDGRISDARREFQQALELAEKAKSELRSMLGMYLNLLDKQGIPALPAASSAAIVAGGVSAAVASGGTAVGAFASSVVAISSSLEPSPAASTEAYVAGHPSRSLP